MSHLAQHPAVRGGDALDGPHRPVGIEGGVHRGRALQVHVLGGDLTVVRQLAQDALRRDEPALAVGDGHAVDLAGGGLHQPGGETAAHPRPHNGRLMPPNGVVGQGGAVPVRVPDFPEGDQPQLHQGLEAVADAQHQAVPVLQQVVDGVRQSGIAQEGDDKFR